MLSKAELYLPPVAPRWARAKDLLAALGGTLVRQKEDGVCLGEAPSYAQLYSGGEIHFPRSMPLTSRAWAEIVHEAVHYHVGEWSLWEEIPFLPFELELSRRIAHNADRRACYSYLMGTCISDEEEGDFTIVEDLLHPGWEQSSEWIKAKERCLSKGLPMDGRLRGEKVRP